MKRIFLPILLGVLMISAVLPSAVVFAGNDVPGRQRKQKVKESVLRVKPITGTWINLAHIGLTEEEAMKNGYSIHVARIPAAMIPRARTLHSIDGMLKAIVDIHTGRILGCTLLCADAPEVINTVASIMKTGQRYHFLRDFIFTHPSMNEGLNMLFKPF